MVPGNRRHGVISVLKSVGSVAAVPAFFAVRIASALVLLWLSTRWLTVDGFGVFSQLLMLCALANMIAIGGTQNGLIQQSAVAPDNHASGRIRGAAVSIWLGVLLCFGGLATLFARQISTLLIGDERLSWVVPWLVISTLVAGPGQILTSMLTGKGRINASLLAQGMGLVVGTAAAAYWIARGEAEVAAVAFTLGAWVTLALATLFSLGGRNLALRFDGVVAQIRTLLRFSAALVGLASFTAAILFGLRYQYQQVFGLTLLGYWIAANRISDTSTQFLGLGMAQLFLPAYARAEDAAARRRLVVTAAVGGVAVMGSFLLAFALFQAPLIRIFMSEKFLPAAFAILLYMTGDVLRVLVSLAMHVQLGRGRPLRFAAIEIATLSIMAAITLGLVRIREPAAPMIGYAAAYGIVAFAATIWWAASIVRRIRSERTEAGLV